MSKAIKNRLYRHFKGEVYRILEIGTDSETLDKVIIYQSTVDGKIWIRGQQSFEQTIDRFEILDESNN